MSKLLPQAHQQDDLEADLDACLNNVHNNRASMPDHEKRKMLSICSYGMSVSLERKMYVTNLPATKASKAGAWMKDEADAYWLRPANRHRGLEEYTKLS